MIGTTISITVAVNISIIAAAIVMTRNHQHSPSECAAGLPQQIVTLEKLRSRRDLNWFAIYGRLWCQTPCVLPYRILNLPHPIHWESPPLMKPYRTHACARAPAVDGLVVVLQDCQPRQRTGCCERHPLGELALVAPSIPQWGLEPSQLETLEGCISPTCYSGVVSPRPGTIRRALIAECPSQEAVVSLGSESLSRAARRSACA